MQLKRVWIVRFSNYEPPEIDSIWTSLEEAVRRLDELDGDWGVTPWTLNTGGG
jgi:hypothetical protein